ncbi:DUF4389 domain-containing protein [Aestuariibius sp. HNIBRBA575]|uniref:DUF4389 domain-containing protein n=1 Tax=Aestuariibius sp. HNIBRBA575 TaxID=3233343 RepID=UPI0034A26721
MADPNEFDDVMPENPSRNTDGPREIEENVFGRVLHMIVIWIMMGFAQSAIGVLALLQVVILLVNNKQPNERVADLGTDIGIWVAKAARYLTAASDVKPWPWTELD